MSEKWELSEEEILKLGHIIKDNWFTEFHDWNTKLAHAASLKAREETLKEIGEWLETIRNTQQCAARDVNEHYHIDQRYLAALKAGRKP